MGRNRRHGPWGVLLAWLPALLAAAVPAGVQAQTFAVGARAGSFGLGGEAVLGLGRIALRAGAGVVPFTPRGTLSGIRYEIEPPSPLLTAGADLQLTGGLRLIGGVLFGADRTEFTARPAGNVQVGNRSYSPAELGRLEGVLRTRSVAPFLGLGFGSYADSPLGLTLDLGVALLGDGDLELTPFGPVATDATFLQELERERLDVQEDLRRYARLLPVLSLGIHLAVPR